MSPSFYFCRKETTAWKLFEASPHLRKLVLVAAKEHGRRRGGEARGGGGGAEDLVVGRKSKGRNGGQPGLCLRWGRRLYRKGGVGGTTCNAVL